LLTNSENYWNTDIKSVRSALQNLKYSATPFQLDNIIAKIKLINRLLRKILLLLLMRLVLIKTTKNSDAIGSFICYSKAEQKNNVSIDSVFINKTLEDFMKLLFKYLVMVMILNRFLFHYSINSLPKQ
jgi:hypothetical protein